MSSGELSIGRLGRLHDVMNDYVGRDVVPGLVAMVSHRDEVHVDAIGVKTLGAGDPMRRDTIFRITSMTKPVTAVAAMILVEECKLRLDEPVDRLLPELADRVVLRLIDGPLDDTVPANRPITLWDLLTFRPGFGIVLEPPDSYPIQTAITELGIPGFGPPDPSAPHDPDEWMRRLGTLPLMHQPGEQWMYNTGSSVLGVLVSRAADQPLETFLRERIFGPLCMRDTGFSVPPEKLDRLAGCYAFNSETGELELDDDPADSRWARQPAFPDGGAGLVSTVGDYLAFGRMLLQYGKCGSERILSRPSVELMTSDQLTPEQRAASNSLPLLLGSQGWGFGMAVVTTRDDVSSVPGRYGWNGGYGTTWSSDPREGVVGILMTQRMLDHEMMNLLHDFWTSVYQAIDD